MKCERLSCGHVWKTRIKQPQSCPKCKGYIKWNTSNVKNAVASTKKEAINAGSVDSK